MAGPWLRFRGHLDHISNNCLIGAVNAYNMKTNYVKNQPMVNMTPSKTQAYKAAGIPSIVVGDHNYGEGSSREHGHGTSSRVVAVLVKSFAGYTRQILRNKGC